MNIIEPSEHKITLNTQTKHAKGQAPTGNAASVELGLVKDVRGGGNVGVFAPGDLCGEVDLAHTHDGLQPAAQPSVARADLNGVL